MRMNAEQASILRRRKSTEALQWTRNVMTRLGLTLNITKRCVRDARKETFDFLGYTFGQQVTYTVTGQRRMDARPSRKSVKRVKRNLQEVLDPWNTGPWVEVAGRVNRILRGWSNYFNHGTLYHAYRAVDNHRYDRVRHFLRRRHKIASGGTRRSDEEGGRGGLSSLRRSVASPSLQLLHAFRRRADRELGGAPAPLQLGIAAVLVELERTLH
jgi:RNA-directed DNA polymerase